MRKLVSLLICIFSVFGQLHAQDSIKTIHVIVALCDNVHQGIVPVSKTLGNGQDPANNLYWGAMYGVKTIFSNSDDWHRVEGVKPENKRILERCVFKHKTDNACLVADAYDGAFIRDAVEYLINAAYGKVFDTLKQDSTAIPLGSGADLLVYAGHNGLMDFKLAPPEANDSAVETDVIILACASEYYFRPVLANAHTRALIRTTGLMAPEAYTIEAALAGWLEGEKPSQIRERAATAYSKYQKCSLTAARKLFAGED